MAVEFGITQLGRSKFKGLKGRRVGLLTHASSLNDKNETTADLFFHEKSLKLTTLFSPQQGFFGEEQDNMVETPHSQWRGLPLYSLYSQTRKPHKDMLSNVDTVVVDLIDVGTRIYTFMYTVSLMMEACFENDKTIIVLDRPNPIGGEIIQGITLETEYKSFVGLYPMPTRHGMTIGELATWMNECHRLGGKGSCELSVVPMKNWKRHYYWQDTDHFFVLPSANFPTPDTALTFPGTVYFEGTLISEGRGTTRPLEQIGAPFIDPEKCLNYLDQESSGWRRGVYVRSTAFRPTFQKLAGQVCWGLFFHPTDRKIFNPVITCLSVMRALYELYPNKFEWKKPPYEYEKTKTPIDVISGTPFVRHWVEGREPWKALKDREKTDVAAFSKEIQPYLMYK